MIGMKRMIDTERLIFIHGLEGTSQGVKATLLQELFTGICIPDFSGSLEERMTELEEILQEIVGWTIVGSSFGGLMGALYTCRYPDQVKKLVLLAPALIWPDFASSLPEPISVPVVIYHGMRDRVIPLEPVRALSERVFLNLDFQVVDDDHGLFKTVHAIDWITLLDG
jgi:pimeloyl-ACP methyl ester carboxylesterase